MLRVGLLQMVAERAIETGHREHDHEHADFWASRLLSAARLDPDELAFALALLAREQPNPSPYVVDRRSTRPRPSRSPSKRCGSGSNTRRGRQLPR